MSRTGVCIGGPLDGLIRTILHGARFVAADIGPVLRPEDVTSDVAEVRRAQYHWEQFGFGPGGGAPVGFWLWEGCDVRQAMQLLLSHYAGPAPNPVDQAAELIKPIAIAEARAEADRLVILPAERRPLPELVDWLQRELRRRDYTPEGSRRFRAACEAIKTSLDELTLARREAGDALAGLDPPDLANPEWRKRQLDDWPPGVPGARRQARSARVATILDPVSVWFVIGGDSEAHMRLEIPPVGMRLEITITWREAAQLAATHQFSGVTMDEILLAMLAADVGRRVHVRRPAG